MVSSCSSIIHWQRDLRRLLSLHKAPFFLMEREDTGDSLCCGNLLLEEGLGAHLLYVEREHLWGTCCMLRGMVAVGM